MSQFFSERYAALTPYTPGEQPTDKRYVKLNTNESPFPPSPSVVEAVRQAGGELELYPDPECFALRREAARVFGVAPEQILMTNGSDEGLDFAFMAFGDEEHPLVFPDITYGFYPVYAQRNHIPYRTIPLNEDFSLDVEAYVGVGSTVVIANPNAPTGRSLSAAQIERIVRSNPRNVVIIDEAYVDFGGESAVPLVNRYDNLLVIGTFSKSRSMAGARLGYCIGHPALIADLNTIKYAVNPYTINRMTNAAGIAALQDNAYYMENCRTIIETRTWVTEELERRGFEVLPSKANFVFARSEAVDGEALYAGLKERGVLVRHFTLPRIRDFVRITIGTRAQMEVLLEKTDEILKEVAI